MIDDLRTDQNAARLERVAGWMSEALAAFEQDEHERLGPSGYLKLGSYVPMELKGELRREAKGLAERCAKRRDVRIRETGGSPRLLSNVVKEDIDEHGLLIPVVYRSSALTQLLQLATGDEIRPCRFEPEQYLVITHDQKGDTHGWHWGDYSYVVVWVLEAPPARQGGSLQCIPGVPWDKENPDIERHLAEREVTTYDHRSGDVYLLKSDTTLHRTTPLKTDTSRTIVRMAFMGRADKGEPDHGTMREAFM